MDITFLLLEFQRRRPIWLSKRSLSDTTFSELEFQRPIPQSQLSLTPFSRISFRLASSREMPCLLFWYTAFSEMLLPLDLTSRMPHPPLDLTSLFLMVLFIEVERMPASPGPSPEFLTSNPSMAAPSADMVMPLPMPPASITGFPAPVSRPLRVIALSTTTFLR